MHLVKGAAVLGLCAAALAGCTSDNDTMEMEWVDRSHVRMSMHHGMDHTGMMGRMSGMSMMGPNGTVPMHMWDGDGLCPMAQVQSCPMRGAMSGWMMHGGTHTMQMHAVRHNGTWGMAMMPEGKEWSGHMHMDMMPGEYSMSMPGMTTSRARLG